MGLNEDLGDRENIGSVAANTHRDRVLEGYTLRGPLVNDYVTIHSALCEWDGVSGQVIGVSDRPDNDMPVMVQRSNYDVWPFAVWELELHSPEDEAYEGGWIDPRITIQRKG